MVALLSGIRETKFGRCDQEASPSDSKNRNTFKNSVKFYNFYLLQLFTKKKNFSGLLTGCFPGLLSLNELSHLLTDIVCQFQVVISQGKHLVAYHTSVRECPFEHGRWA